MLIVRVYINPIHFTGYPSDIKYNNSSSISY